MSNCNTFSIDFQVGPYRVTEVRCSQRDILQTVMVETSFQTFELTRHNGKSLEIYLRDDETGIQMFQGYDSTIPGPEALSNGITMKVKTRLGHIHALAMSFAVGFND